MCTFTHFTLARYMQVSSVSVNATCVRNSLVASIQKRQPGCWYVSMWLALQMHVLYGIQMH
jgi:hypothetical protein